MPTIEAIAATKKQITYRLNNDGSVILRSLVGTSIKVLKMMNDDELRAIGLFKTLIGKDEKFFPTDETLELQYQEKAIAATDTLFLNKKQLCDRIKLNYKNLSTNAGKQNMTADSFMLHTAKQQGEIWEKTESKGREALWKLVKILTP